ncbi:MAG: peptidylprolyl isomerase [Clostridia bacterium]|nr:peptidylprolyl isomerase [Clostridia bacterium]
MKFYRILSLLLVFILLIPASVSCSDNEGIDEGDFQAEVSETATNYVMMEISYTSSERKLVTGKIVIELDPTAAPITVQNFQGLVADGFYDGLTFHRVYKGFMIQGGDPDGDGSGGSPNKIKGEFSANGHNNPISHTRGVISMARSGLSYDSASSQFFIVHEDSTFLDGQYAAFGRVIYGMNTVDGIARTQVTYSAGADTVPTSPVNPVTINYAKFVTVSGNSVTVQSTSNITSTVDLSTVEPFVSEEVTTQPSTTAPQPTVTSTVQTATTAPPSTEPTPIITTEITTESDNEPTPPQPDPPQPGDPDFSTIAIEDYQTTDSVTDLVLLTVSYTDEDGIRQSGKIVFRLFPSIAPQTVSHFQALVAAHTLDGSAFFRIVKGYLLCGGITDCETVTGEFSANGKENTLSHVRGTVSMLRGADYNSATGQFFILQRAYPQYDGQYAAFAFVAYGMDTVDAIAATPLGLNSETFDQTAPLDPVTITSVHFLTRKEV